ncbi:MAG TPA: peptidase MA family metallohydrolase, partial [Tepidiformaceae bacterium]|nr:peptidase MA family metallohydrolase [Tepidiformaceae bacterium]
TQVVSSTVSNEYPSRLVFKLQAGASSNITDVTLSYRLTGRGSSALAQPTDPVTPGTTVTTEVVVQVNSGASYIPVGSEFVYHWEIRTDDGQSFSSPDETFFFLPPGQDWKSVTNDIMAVYFHGNKEQLANAYLKSGDETWQKMGVQLLNTKLSVVPVKVILFDNEQEMDPARPGAGQGTFDAAVTTCGTKVTADVVLVIPVSCGTPDRTDTLRHEFAHIINQAAGEGPLGKLPSWLDEGTAVQAQSTPGDNYVQAFQSAVARDRLIPFDRMGTPSNDANTVNLFYGQAYFMSKYLADKKGPETYAKFFATIKQGARFDEALKTVYGFDLAGFEQEFRAANELGSQTSPTAAPSPTRPRQSTQPTAVPTPRTRPQLDDNGDGGIGTATILIIGLAVLFALLAVLSFLVAQVMANNRRTATPAGGPRPAAPPPPPPAPSDEWTRPPDLQQPPPPPAAPPSEPPGDDPGSAPG